MVKSIIHFAKKVVSILVGFWIFFWPLFVLPAIFIGFLLLTRYLNSAFATLVIACLIATYLIIKYKVIPDAERNAIRAYFKSLPDDPVRYELHRRKRLFIPLTEKWGIETSLAFSEFISNKEMHLRRLYYSMGSNYDSLNDNQKREVQDLFLSDFYAFYQIAKQIMNESKIVVPKFPIENLGLASSCNS